MLRVIGLLGLLGYRVALLKRKDCFGLVIVKPRNDAVD
jgi:hypothetical protein